VTEQPDRRKLALSQLDSIASALEQRFSVGKTVLSFKEYLELFAENPRRYGRDAATYVRDMFDHYGVEIVDKPWGKLPRYKLFDLPWGDRRRRPGDAPHRPRGAARGGLQVHRELRERGQGEQARAHARPEREREEHHRRVRAAGARALLDARRGGPLPLPLGVPQPQDDPRRDRLR
jgi:hypothetical protein